MPRNTLTPRQEAFAREWIIDGNGKRAAIRAGYSPDNAYAQASENLKHPKILAAIETNRAEMALQADMDISWVLSNLRREAITGDTSSARIRALELCGRHLGMWPRRSLAQELFGDQPGAAASVAAPIDPTSDFTSIIEGVARLLPAAEIAQRAQEAMRYEAGEEDWDD